MGALGASGRQFESGYPDQQGVSEWMKLLVLETSDGTKALSSVGSNPTTLTNGEGSSMVERQIVVLVVAGSSPVFHPKKRDNCNYHVNR